MIEVQKPITVARADFISNLTGLINDSGLPPFVIEPILKDMLNDVRVVAQKQLDADTKRYQEALNEAANASDEEEPQCGND